MNRLSAPPPRLPDDPKLLTLPPGLALLRFYDPARGDWPTKRAYGPLADMRFDHHPPPCRLHADRSVWYAAASLRGAVAESFGAARAARCVSSCTTAPRWIASTARAGH